jgi:hypothetical protein
VWYKLKLDGGNKRVSKIPVIESTRYLKNVSYDARQPSFNKKEHGTVTLSRKQFAKVVHSGTSSAYTLELARLGNNYPESHLILPESELHSQIVFQNDCSPIALHSPNTFKYLSL